jgi:FtsP/CotA-like multicopper oxidase with cupredoxin domain
MITRIIVRFDATGRHVWHCHVLEHAANDDASVRGQFI